MRENRTAFVLAGGRSSRMGEDKALLTFGDQRLVERMLGVAGSVAPNVFIVGSKERYSSFGATVEDIYIGCGPLAGIHAALSATCTEMNLMLSVDMPLMTGAFLSWLVQQAEVTRELVIVPDAAGGQQPLCAIYRRQTLSAVADALRRGEYKIGRLFSRVPTRIIGEQEIVAAGFSPEIFRNINTPEEYAQCQP